MTTDGERAAAETRRNADLPSIRSSLIYEAFGDPLSTLKVAEASLPTLAAGWLRVVMTYAPVNPSDLIPVTGAYAHRIDLPATAGYEGVGHVIEAADGLSHWLGRRVLPLRGEGTWQFIVDCPASHAVCVPETVEDQIAARAYINPLAAWTMLRRWPVRNKTVLLSGAGSNCADYLGHWAYLQGAAHVFGIYRSQSRLTRMRELGIEPVSIGDESHIELAARRADITFDALGGGVASHVIASMPEASVFVGYGLLSGLPIRMPGKRSASYARFHLREHLPGAGDGGMDEAFAQIWPRLKDFDMAPAQIFPARRWREAIEYQASPGAVKPVLDLTDF